MTRFKHDQFAKDYLQELLTLVGRVEVSRELISESRQAKRDKKKLTEADLPNLWILVPSASVRVRRIFGAVEGEAFPEGVYLFPQGYHTGLVVLNQLPKTQDTLWLRILSRGRTQKQALQELEALPMNHPLKGNVEDIANLNEL